MSARLVDVFDDARAMYEYDVIANFDMIDDPRLSAGNHAVADLARACDAEHGCQQTVLADINVVRHVAQVVEFRTAADTRLGVGGTVDCIVGADSNPIADDDTARLRYRVN